MARQVKLIYVEVKVRDEKKTISFKPCLHFFTHKMYLQNEDGKQKTHKV